MQYSPNNTVFTISLVDAGTIELIRGLGKNVVSSGGLALFTSAVANNGVNPAAFIVSGEI